MTKSIIPASTIPNFVAEGKSRYSTSRALTEQQIINAAKAILKKRFKRGAKFTSPKQLKEHLALQNSTLEHEVFTCLFMDNQHCIIEEAELFKGTIDQAAVYPREVVKKALKINAAAIVFCHNHPSGIAKPSHGDITITSTLINALKTVDIRVLDHIIVGGGNTYSFMENKLIEEIA